MQNNSRSAHQKPDEAIYQTAMRRRKAFSLKPGSICRSPGEVKPTPVAESSRRADGLYESKPSKQMVWIYSFSLVRTETFSTVYNPNKIRCRLRPRSDYARSLKHAFSLFSPGAGLRFRLLVGSVSDSAFDPGLRRELVAQGFESASPSERVGKFLVATPLKRLSHCLKRLWSALTLLTCR
jgi:hypothetical protein